MVFPGDPQASTSAVAAQHVFSAPADCSFMQSFVQQVPMSEDRAFVLLQNLNGRGLVYYLWGVGMKHAARFLSHILSPLHADPVTKLHSASAQDWPDELLEISEVTGPCKPELL